ncbi:MAG: chemotaxis-specific protein-glutamate methyltransferase CheB [Gemmatimonadetes bacterium]|nr:chemotaxis-specific protein-glutamate methyltransferase CheB [Gemmatimonadota bacterium]
MIRVFVVDDSAFVRKALRKVLSADPDVTVVGEAASGPEAVLRIPEAAPDVVTLDVEMQGLDGLQVLRQLLAWNPGLHVIMLSALTQAGAEATVEALAIGAADFIDKQSLNLMDLERLGREIGERLRALRRRVPLPRAAPVRAEEQAPDLSGPELCVIGASTGGPAALQHLLEQLPVDFPLPVAIVQHMPPGFTRPFANRLNGLCRLRVSEAVEGDQLRAGRVLIAPAGMHLRISRGLGATLSADAAGARHVPSVDVLFRSAERARPGKVLGVLLTGMGEDGAEGLSLIRAHGGVTIAESEATCAVYGMPRAAVERGAAQHVLPLPAIAAALAALGS